MVLIFFIPARDPCCTSPPPLAPLISRPPLHHQMSNKGQNAKNKKRHNRQNYKNESQLFCWTGISQEVSSYSIFQVKFMALSVKNGRCVMDNRPAGDVCVWVVVFGERWLIRRTLIRVKLDWWPGRDDGYYFRCSRHNDFQAHTSLRDSGWLTEKSEEKKKKQGGLSVANQTRGREAIQMWI